VLWATFDAVEELLAIILSVSKLKFLILQKLN